MSAMPQDLCGAVDIGHLEYASNVLMQAAPHTVTASGCLNGHASVPKTSVASMPIKSPDTVKQLQARPCLFCPLRCRYQ